MLDHGIVAAGAGSFDSLRLEKGYRLWGQDIHTEHDPFEAGLGFAVRMDKGEFQGRAALEAIVDRGLSHKLACMMFDDPSVVVMGKEPIWADGHVVSYVTSAAYGYSIGRGIAYGYLPIEFANEGTAVEILEGYRVPDGGSVRVLGLDPIADGPALKRRIGVMPQESGLYPTITPIEALRLFAGHGGFIVNISSLAGKNAFSGGAAYNASKAGLNLFTEALMLDHRYDGVRVSYIMPGSVNTEFSSDASKSQDAKWKIEPEDIAETVVTVLGMPERTTISRVEIRPSRPKK